MKKEKQSREPLKIQLNLMVLAALETKPEPRNGPKKEKGC
jgi:hypothetical protein